MDQPDPDPKSADAFRWLPASRLARVVLAMVSLAFGALVFSAYLHPAMVFDLANMVFCG